ncbi:FAD-binding oxidoreductase [Gordonia sp. HY442]|uniref:globin domain-containing protein n=1 Tax=Gordonia zhenghanii TaxID=2911516 RepID=UPI001F15E998|nr:globin domain-containing protein [Gordonia zhenghanii]MCF8606872.1 FAD-binding oxidoreductase [Gordonia zhenghanii]
MISTDARIMLEATLPVVAAHIDEITANFYPRMFDEHPELLSDLFNRANQKSGSQSAVLAGSIAAFARLQLEYDEATQRDIIERIANKHASLGIVADQYPIVHKHLFAAIVEVLGDAVTPEVAAAWDELYWEMANVLIGREKELYEQSGVASGEVWRTATITERDQVAPDAVSFTLASTDGRPLPDFVPGQYVSVQVRLDDGARQIRQYSLTGRVGAPTWRFSVKLDGEVSTWLHEHAFDGDELAVSSPFGDLTLPDGDGPLVLASAGIGCTPMIGVLHHLVATGDTRPVQVMHADRSRARQPHRGELGRLVAQLPDATLYQWYEHGVSAEPTTRIGLIDLADVPVDPAATALVCGPTGFMSSVRDALVDRSLPAERIQFEAFGGTR